MASAGWYPDPSGAPGGFRYWDGSAWGPQTTTDPSAPLPGGEHPQTVRSGPGAPAGPPPGAPPARGAGGWADPSGQPGFARPPTGGTGGGTGAGGGRPGGRTALLVLAALLGLVLVAGGAFLGVRALSGDDRDPDPGPTDATGSADPSDPTSDDVDPDDLDPDNPTPTQCDGGDPFANEPSQDDGRIQSGGISIPYQDDYNLRPRFDKAFTFADRVSVAVQRIEVSFVSVYALGELSRDNGYVDLEQSARTVITCMAQSPDFYAGETQTEESASDGIEVGGATAWQVDAEIRSETPGSDLEGDAARVVVVDTGAEDHFALFISLVPIGDQRLLAQQERATEELEVDVD